MAELVDTIQEVVQNVLTLARYASGSSDEQQFHNKRIKNGKWFIAYKKDEDYLFSPSKFAGYRNNNTDHQYDLENRDGGITNQRFTKILGNHYDSGDQGYEEIDNAFLGYCQKHGIAASKHHRPRRYWLVAADQVVVPADIKSIQYHADQINLRAHSHPIGRLQEIRANLKKLRRQPGTDIFSSQTIYSGWAFHHGGRSELQFNIGAEDIDDRSMLRHGLAFSFELSQTLPSIDPLIPKVRLFNEFIRLYPDLYADMRMWHYKNGIQSTDYSPAPIPSENAMEKVFVFLGKRQLLDAINYDQLLADFDRLLPLYQFVESGGTLQPISTTTKETFDFRAGCSLKAVSAVASYAQKQLDVNLRHNVLQQALYHLLAQKYGAENVATENPSGTGNKVDVILRKGKAYWFYEIKTAQSPRACIREAVGQLLEYSLWPESQTAERLIVVGEGKLDADGEEYLKRLQSHFNLPIYYEQITPMLSAIENEMASVG